MKKKKMKCETCELNGYNAEFCRWHKKKITEIDVRNCRPQDFYKKIGRTAVLGAGVGVVAATAGLAVVPAVGLKGFVGHAIAAKLTAGGGAAGAGINLARHAKESHPESKKSKKKSILLPLYLNGGS
ncbi:MAG: hypothetical protein ABII06_09890 [Pseudomonadota bacterium]